MNYSLDAVAELARRMKQDRVREHGDSPEPGATDLPVHATAVRRAEPIANVWAGEGPEGARNAVFYAAGFFRADVVYLIADSFVRRMPKGTDPDKLDIRPGQLQEEWSAGDHSTITECMFVYRVPFIGDATSHFYPYTRKRRRIEWEVVPDQMKPDRLEGAIPDYARDGYRTGRENFATLMPVLVDAAHQSGLPEAERDYHIDAGCARLVSGIGLTGPVMLIAGPEPRLFIKGEEVE
jgi:hypothetical protein